MNSERPLRLAIVAGEESGDLLGADLVRALASASGRSVELIGVGGRHLQALGLDTLFDPSEHRASWASQPWSATCRACSARIGTAARAVVAGKPDCLVTIDSPDFNLRVAKRVRAGGPGDPDRALCLPQRLGVAAGARGEDAAGRRPGALHPAVRGRYSLPGLAARPGSMSAIG